MSIPSLNIVKTTKDLANASKSENIPRNSDENDTIEVYNSFRPSVSTKMSAMKMDTLEISSDSETEEESRKISQPKQKVFTKQSPSSNKLKQQQQALLKMPSLPNGIQINRQTPKSSPFVNKNISLTRTGVSSPRINRAVPTSSNANTPPSNVLRSVINSPRITRTGVSRSPSICKTSVGRHRTTGTVISSSSPKFTTLVMNHKNNKNMSNNPHLPSQQDKTYKSQKTQNLAWNQALLNRICTPPGKSSSPSLSLSERIAQAYQKKVTNDENQLKMYKCGLCFYKTAEKEDLEMHWRYNCRPSTQTEVVK